MTSPTSPFTGPFRSREYRFLWAAGAQSSMGDQIARIAIALLVFSRTHSAADTATTYALTYLPAIVGAAFLSGLADKFPRRRVMVSCDLTRFALLVALALLPLSVLELDVLLVLLVVAGAPFEAAEVALLPDVLPEADYQSGSSLRMTTDQLVQLIAFAAGGVLVALLGTKGTLLLDSATFLLSAALLRVGLAARPAPRSQPDAAAGPVPSAWRTSLSLVAGPGLPRTLLLFIWIAAFSVAPEGIATAYASQLHGGAALTGLLMAAPPAGTCLGYLLTSRFLDVSRQRRYAAPMAIATFACLTGCLIPGGPALALLLLFLAGLFSIYLFALMPWFVQCVPDHVRGQVLGFGRGGLIGGQGVSLILAGLLASATSPSTAIALAGCCGLIAAGLLTISLAARIPEPVPRTAA